MKPFYSDQLKMRFNPPTVYKCNNKHSHFNDLSDGQIIEFTFDKDSNSFVLYHIRTDKTLPNNIKVANDTFVDMAHEFSLIEFQKLLKGDGDDQKYNEPNKSPEEKHCLENYRKYHNAVKNDLIKKNAQDKTVIDLGAGKGGDLIKYKNAHIKFLWAIEPFEENLVNPDDGMYKRINNIYHSNDFLKYSDDLEIRKTPDVPIMTINTGAEDYDKIYKALNKTHKYYFKQPPPNKIDTQKAQVITSFFSMSFFFSDNLMLESVIKTISSLVYQPINRNQPNGLFIGTMMDGEKTYTMLQENNGIIEKPNCYYIKRLYNEDEKLGIGNKIAVNLSGTPTVSGEQIEWLAPFEDLKRRLRFNSFRLREKFSLDDAAKYGITLTPEQQTLSELYIGFVFEKISDTESQKDLVVDSLPTSAFKQYVKGTFLYPGIYDDVVYRTGTIGDGSCFFHSFLLSFLLNNSNKQSKIYRVLSQSKMREIVKLFRKLLADNFNTEFYTRIKTTESPLKLLNALEEVKIPGISKNDYEKIATNLQMELSNIYMDKNYHQKFKEMLLTEIHKYNKNVSMDILDRVDQREYMKLKIKIRNVNEWATNFMFDYISILLQINIFIITDYTGKPSSNIISCDSYNPDNPCIIVLNIGGGDGHHFEPLFVWNKENKKFLFSFTDPIIQNMYKIMCPNSVVIDDNAGKKFTSSST